MKYYTLLVTGFVLMTQYSTAQNYSLSDFEEVAIPAKYSEQLNRWNHAVDKYFKVAIIDGCLQISKENYKRQSVKFQVTGGNLIGENYGEFGGGIYYAPTSTKVKQILVNGKIIAVKEDSFVQGLVFVGKSKSDRATMIPVKSGNIKDIFDYKGTIYTVEGLAHLTLSFGSFTKLTVENNEINYDEILKLDDAPMAYAVSNGAIYLATLERFYIIRDWKPQLMADKLFWHSLYPNSVAVKDSKHIYLGMRAGYAMIDADTGKVTFFQYKE